MDLCKQFIESLPKREESKKVEIKDIFNFDSCPKLEDVTTNVAQLVSFETMSEASKAPAREMTSTKKFIHPNNPANWIERKQVNIPRPNSGMVMNGQYYPPMNYMQMYNNMMQAKNYIQNRGQWQMNYILEPSGPLNHPDEQKSRAWIPKFTEQMQKELNSPVAMGLPYFQKELTQEEEFARNGFIPARPEMFESREDKLDKNYYRLKEEQQYFIDKYKNGGVDGMGSISSNHKKDAARRKTPEEIAMRQSIRNSVTTPSINPKYLDYNSVTKSGEKYWSLSKAQEQMKCASDFATSMMTPAERSRVLAATMKGYNKAINTEIGSILESSPLDDSEESPAYARAGMNQYMNYFNRGYSYMTDSDGLPTRYFDDGGKFMEQLTLTDIKNGFGGKFKVIDTDEGKRIVVTNVSPKIPYDRAEPGCGKVYIINYSEDDDNETTVINSIKVGSGKVLEGEELEQFIEKHNKQEYIKEIISGDKNRVPTEKEQYLGDDLYFLVKELSRYNEELADALLWYKANAKIKDYEMFAKKCREQLILYRNEDPFSIIKSGVFCAGDKLIITQSKPTTLKELESVMKVEEERVAKFGDNQRARLQLEALKKGTTLKEKVCNLKNVRNLLVIEKSKDVAMTILQNILANVSEKRRQQLDAYHIWKRMMFNRNMDYSKIMANFDKDFDEWWNIPNPNTPKDELFIDRYNTRMSQLQQDYFADREAHHRLPNNYRMLNLGRRFWNEYNKVNQGLIRPNMTTAEFFAVLPHYFYNMEEQKALVEGAKLTKYRGYNPQAYINMANQIGRRAYARENPDAPNMYNNPSYTPIYNNPEEYNRRQQMFVEEMFQTRKLGMLL